MLKLTLAVAGRCRDLLRSHHAELRTALGEEASKAAAAAAERKRRAATARPPSKLSKADRAEAQKRLRLSLERSKKENFERWQQEQVSKERAAMRALSSRGSKVTEKEREARFQALERDAKNWAKRKNEARTRSPEPPPRPPDTDGKKPLRLGESDLERSTARLATPKKVFKRPQSARNQSPAWRPPAQRSVPIAGYETPPKPRRRPASARPASPSRGVPWDDAALAVLANLFQQANEV